MEKKVKHKKSMRNILLKEENISLVLNSYEEIFSDFDPRPYNERSLSHDFIMECKRASADKPDKGIELRFLIPRKKRNSNKEIQIKKRLQDHFKKHLKEKQKFVNSMKFEGLVWSMIGLCMMFLATYVLFTYQKESLLTSFLVILLEPSGWFLFWEGLEKLIIKAKEETPDLKFYRKMNDSKIYFLNY